MEEKQLEHMRHTLAHLLAAATLSRYPDAKLTLGPAIENGFYYDIDFGDADFSENDLPKIEKQMRKLLPTWKEFTHETVSLEEAKKRYAENPYKLELIQEIADRGEDITLYTAGDFTDLCRGGHSEHPSKEIQTDAFTLTRVAGAYWRGDEKNPMLTRIYGVAFATKEELDAYLTMLEEAKKRDHKKLGKELELFTFSPRVGPGLPLFLPHGMTMRHELETYIRDLKQGLGYSFVGIPHIAKRELYETSGHMGKYDAMMPVMKDSSGTEFVMKAMNCPHHFELFNSSLKSYKDLPLRLAETTTVYRNEKSGELHGLTRVLSITQDDTHHFVRPDQIESEIEMILGLMDTVYSVFGFTDYRVQVSIRDSKKPEQYFGDDALWTKSESILIDAVKAWGKPYVIEEGEAAFYGPKIDIMVRDSIGREWQLTTCQLDFNQPENFDMTYVGEDGEKHRPAVLHVAILGSVERFMGILIEHFAGKFPLWLSPVQARVLAVSEKFQGYASEVAEQLSASGVRAELSPADETLGKRIRAAEKSRTPYVLVVGEKEKESGTVSIRHYREGDLGELSTDALLERMTEEITTKKI